MSKTIKWMYLGTSCAASQPREHLYQIWVASTSNGDDIWNWQQVIVCSNLLLYSKQPYIVVTTMMRSLVFTQTERDIANCLLLILVKKTSLLHRLQEPLSASASSHPPSTESQKTNGPRPMTRRSGDSQYPHHQSFLWHGIPAELSISTFDSTKTRETIL